jgi:4-methyl-5(b-hydroxyethyl)-thiazole monophosphate biosynthesis
MKMRVLCLITDGFEEIETVTPVDLLRRAGAEVVVASMTVGIHVTGRSGITLHADALFADLDISTFDVLLIPGGPQVQELRTDGRVLTTARIFASANKTITAICAAPLVLHEAGLLTGKKFTAHDSTYSELKSALPHERVVVDGTLITSRGAGTALEFGLAIIEQIYGTEAAAQVARAIMV